MTPPRPTPRGLLDRLPRRPADAAAAFDGVAESVGRLAALVAAGATQQAAWTYLADSATDPDERRMARTASAAAGRGLSIAAAFATEPGAAYSAAGRVTHSRTDRAQDGTAAAWRLVGLLAAAAVDMGAPLAATLDRTAANLRGIADLHRAVATAAAGPLASIRLMLALPPMTALLGWALGFDVPGVLFGSPFGLVDTGLAAALLLAASRWNRRLTRSAARLDALRGIRLDLVAIGVHAGLPPGVAATRVAVLAETAGVELPQADAAAVEEAIAFASAAGVPLAALLRAEADRLRRVELAVATARAAALATRLLVPLGLCVLPAFILIGVVPIGVAVFASTGLSI